MKQFVISSALITVTSFSASAYSSSNDQVHPAPSASQRQHVPIVPTKIIDAALGFEVELKVDNADVCVLWPKRLQDAAACAGLDTETFNQHYALVKRGPLVMATLRYDDGTATLTILASGGVIKSEDQIAAHYAGLAKGLASSSSMIVKMTGSQPGSQYDLLQINGIDAGHYEATLETPPNSPEPHSKHSLGYTLFGDRSFITIQFSTDPVHVNQMRQSAASIMKTVHWSSPTSKEFVNRVAPAQEKRSVDRAPHAQEKRSAKTYDWVAGLALVIVMVGAMFALKSRAKRQD